MQQFHRPRVFHSAAWLSEIPNRDDNMSAQVEYASDGVVTLKVSGTLTESELLQAQQAMAKIIRSRGKVRILVVTENFSGWEKGRDWADLSFQEEFDPCIEKMAIVGEQRWEELAMLFVASGLRTFPIEYFTSGELDQALAWLKAVA
jgi:hypothetical protein